MQDEHYKSDYIIENLDNYINEIDQLKKREKLIKIGLSLFYLTLLFISLFIV